MADEAALDAASRNALRLLGPDPSNWVPRQAVGRPELGLALLDKLDHTLGRGSIRRVIWLRLYSGTRQYRTWSGGE